MEVPQRNARERAWASYDIVAAIFETMSPGPPLEPRNLWELNLKDHTRPNRNALARMARVSRALSGVALDVLWRYANNIFHLINAVPSCYTYESGGVGLFGEEKVIVSSCIAACGSTC